MPDDLAKDVRATAAAASDLGPEYHEALAGSLADRVEQELARRRGPAPMPYQPPTPSKSGQDTAVSIVIGVGSLVLGVPLSAIAGNFGGLAGILVCWIGIVLVNIAHAWSRKR